MQRYLDESQQRRLLASASELKDPLAQRDYHWMAALLLTGMRIAEFSRLKKLQVQQALATGWLVSDRQACKGKRNANDYLVTAQLRMHLQALLALSDQFGAGVAPPPEGQPLVWGRIEDGAGAALSVRSYEARLKIWAEKAGIDRRISPHWLRHTLGMNVMRRSRSGNAIKVAQRALNHASLKSTGIYLEMSREEFAKEMQVVAGGRVPRRVARQMAQGAAA